MTVNRKNYFYKNLSSETLNRGVTKEHCIEPREVRS